MRLFRSGIFEYDKTKPRKVRICLGCGCEIGHGTAARKRCGPCQDARYQERVAANRPKYRGKKYGKARVAT